MEWKDAPEIKKEIERIIRVLRLSYIDSQRIVCFRSFGSVSRARARIWSLPRVWQKALNIPAHYIIEVIDHRFGKLSSDDQERTLIHELLHIPKNFSGSLVPHRTRGFRLSEKVEILFKSLEK